MDRDEVERIAFIGFGYTAKALARRLSSKGWVISGSSQSHKGADKITGQGHIGFVFNAITSDDHLIDALSDATHIIVSAPPISGGCPVLNRIASIRDQLAELYYVGYLSTVGVYGDHGGAWVDEDTPPNPHSDRSRRRLDAENAWIALGADQEFATSIFRLPGIYGPGRSAFDRLEAGTARRINKQDQVFNRMHVDDIAGAIEAELLTETYHEKIINIVDDLPAPPQDVIAYAAELMGIEPPPEIAFENAELSDMARSFYGENKRVSNKRMKTQINYQPQYPTFREGLQAIWQTR